MPCESLRLAIKDLEEVLSTPLDERRIVVDATTRRFVLAFESSWKTLKRFLLVEGVETKSPRETLKKAYQFHWLEDEQLWLDMMHDRNATSHIYDEDKAHAIYLRIKLYCVAMRQVYDKLANSMK